jgi:hypothetical protein
LLEDLKPLAINKDTGAKALPLKGFLQKKIVMGCCARKA